MYFHCCGSLSFAKMHCELLCVQIFVPNFGPLSTATVSMLSMALLVVLLYNKSTIYTSNHIHIKLLTVFSFNIQIGLNTYSGAIFQLILSFAHSDTFTL